jgi:glycosyltransferase involved in cell wall biosynthesis
MRIAYDHQIFSFQEYGGVSRYFIELAYEVAKYSEIDACVVAPYFKNRYLKNASSSVKVYGKHISGMRYTKRLIKGANKIIAKRTLKNIQPEIVHETYYSSESAAPKCSKIVLTVYDMIHEIYPDNFSPDIALRDDKKIAIDRADHIICISENTRKDLIELLDIPSDKISVIHLGFAVNFDENSQAIDKKLSKPFILYVGERSRPYKNFKALLHAYARSRKLQNDFMLKTFGGGVFTDEERNQMELLGIADNNVQQMFGNDSVLADLYKTAVGFVYPSLYEGFGIPPLEAMGFDCPVICSNTSSIPEVVGNAGEYFDPLSVDDLQDKLECVLYNNEKREKLIQRGRERIKLFTWGKCASDTVDVYQRLLT